MRLSWIKALLVSSALCSVLPIQGNADEDVIVSVPGEILINRPEGPIHEIVQEENKDRTLVIIATWPETYIDVDLIVKAPDESEAVMYINRYTKKAILLFDSRQVISPSKNIISNHNLTEAYEMVISRNSDIEGEWIINLYYHNYSYNPYRHSNRTPIANVTVSVSIVDTDGELLLEKREVALESRTEERTIMRVFISGPESQGNCVILRRPSQFMRPCPSSRTETFLHNRDRGD